MWKNQNTWCIQSWKLYSYSGVHVLETVDGLVLHMFVDKKYPLTVNLIERMLDHQLEIGHKQEGNALTTIVQLIAFLKKQVSDSQRPKSTMGITLSGSQGLSSPQANGYVVKAYKIRWWLPVHAMEFIVAAGVLKFKLLLLFLLYVVPTSRVIATDSVIVASSGYVVPAAYDIRPDPLRSKPFEVEIVEAPFALLLSSLDQPKLGSPS
ncbi:hypothetical protein Tco_1063120 [Tanacetum coccineum]